MIARSGYQFFFLHELHYLGPWSIFDAYVYLQDIVTSSLFFSLYYYFTSLWCVLFTTLSLSLSVSTFFSLLLLYFSLVRAFYHFIVIIISKYFFFFVLFVFVCLIILFLPVHDGSRANRREDLRCTYINPFHTSTSRSGKVARSSLLSFTCSSFFSFSSASIARDSLVE